MDLLEYQVKEWFGKMGIPVLPSQRINHPTDLKHLKISYPIVLKSQVHASDREKAGGVRIVETTIDAIAAAQSIFNLSIWGEIPEVLLAEAKYDALEKLYLAVVLDTALCRPVLLGSREPNSDGESWGDKMQYVVVEKEFSPFYARRLVLKMGIQGTLMQSISNVVEKMYHLFIQEDLDLVEINPLAINAHGQVMALNGKVKVNERAINRHPEIAKIAVKVAGRQNSNHKNHYMNSVLGSWDSLEMLGKIGILSYGAGSLLATLDLVTKAGGEPGVCLNLRHSFLADITPTTFCQRLEKGLNILTTNKIMQVILINFVGNVPQVDQIPEVIARFMLSDQQESKDSKIKHDAYLPRLVVRLGGGEFNQARKYLAGLKIPYESLIVVENLDIAVEQATRLAQLPGLKK